MWFCSPCVTTQSHAEGRLNGSAPLARALARESPLLSVQVDELDKPADKPASTGFTKGSLWGTVFNMCAATLGAGALSLPHAMAQMGIVPGLAVLGG